MSFFRQEKGHLIWSLQVILRVALLDEKKLQKAVSCQEQKEKGIQVTLCGASTSLALFSVTQLLGPVVQA